jgi:hypothetical protein
MSQMSKRNVKLILKILSDLEPLRGSSNKQTLYSTRSCVNWAFPTRAKKGPIYTQTRQINYYYATIRRVKKDTLLTSCIQKLFSARKLR